MFTKPSTLGPNPLMCGALFAANKEANVLPWKAPWNVIILFFFLKPKSKKYFRATLMLVSVASAPELQKNTE